MFISSLFFSTHPPTDDIYTLSLHDALPISHDNDVSFECLIIECGIFLNRQSESRFYGNKHQHKIEALEAVNLLIVLDRKSTRLNSSHVAISYAVFCLKKKNKRYMRQ